MTEMTDDITKNYAKQSASDNTIGFLELTFLEQLKNHVKQSYLVRGLIELIYDRPGVF